MTAKVIPIRKPAALPPADGTPPAPPARAALPVRMTIGEDGLLFCPRCSRTALYATWVELHAVGFDCGHCGAGAAILRIERSDDGKTRLRWDVRR